MKNNLTELIFILDRSGSMSGLEADTIGGFNSMLKRQRSENGAALVTTVLFDDHTELLHNRIPLDTVSDITDREYYVRGCTALMDAVGQTLTRIAAAQAASDREHRPDRTVCIIITDGMENASKRYSADTVRGMIQMQKAHGWEFLFLGANIDAVGAASRIGIDRSRAANYNADSAGTKLNFEVLSETVSAVRRCCPAGSGWKERIDRDYAARAQERCR